MDILTQTILAIFPSLLTGIVLAVWNRRQDEREAKADKQEAERRKSELVQLDLLVTTAELSRATAIAMKDGHTNGETSAALNKYESAITKFREFEREKLAE